MASVLLVEDAMEARGVIAAMLRRIVRAEVLEADDGDAAARICERHPDHLAAIVAAVQALGKYTDPAVRRIHAARPGVAMLLISTLPPDALLEAGYLDPRRLPGPAALLQKPFTLRQLEDAWQRAMQL